MENLPYLVLHVYESTLGLIFLELYGLFFDF